MLRCIKYYIKYKSKTVKRGILKSPSIKQVIPVIQ